MELKKEVLKFACIAHDGQVRKSDIDKPYIIHPIDVANKLEKYGFNDEVICGGILHDVVEDTCYTMTDIKRKFGKDICSFVDGASEDDKTLSWEERKQATIDKLKYLDLQHKAIACCDKLSNLEDISILFGKKGYVDFSAFKRGFEQQKWYYNNIYESLIYNEDSNLEMFCDLKKLINLVFDNSNSFNKEYLSILKSKKKELEKLQSIFNDKSLDINCVSVDYIDSNINYFIKYYLDRINVKTIVNEDRVYGEYYKFFNMHNEEEIAMMIIDNIMDDLYNNSLNNIRKRIKEVIR